MMATPTAFAQTDTATADLDVNATLSAAFSISCDTALTFGEIFVPLHQSGEFFVTVSLNPNVGRTFSPALSTPFGDTFSRGSCSIAGGTPGEQVRILYVDKNGSSISEITLIDDTNPNALSNLKVDTFRPQGESSFDRIADLNGTGILDEDGNGTFEVGGTLRIPSDLDIDEMGDYIGTIRIKVEDDP